MEYRFYLYHKDNGRYLPIVDPQGWDGMQKHTKRFGMDGGVAGPWHGIFFSYDVKLRFVKDGKDFVQAFFEKYGIEQDILLRIDRRNLRSRVFETYYEGRLNLHTYKSGTITVECNVEQTGFIQKLKNRADVKVAMDATTDQDGVAMIAAPTETITMHSKVLRKTFERDLDLTAYADTPAAAGTYYYLFGFQKLVSDEISDRFNYYATQMSSIDPVPALKYVWRVKEGDQGAYTFTFDINLRRYGTVVTGTTKIFLVYGKPGAYTTNQIDATVAWINLEQIQQFAETVNVTLAVGDEVYVYGEMVMTGTNIHAFYEDYFVDPVTLKSVIKVEADTVTAESTCKVVLLHEALEQTVRSITGKANSFYSEYYGRTDIGYAADGAGSLRGITNINQIRGIDKPIRCTMKDLVDTTWALDAIGIGIEKADGAERVRVEPLTYWYQAKRLMRLNYVLDIEKGVLAELYFNQVDGGTDKWSNEKTTNLDEFNASREWTFPITQVKNKLPLRVPYITSGYTIEFARRENNTPTKDTPRDEDNVIIRLVRDGGDFVPAKDEAFDTVSNVISPETSYNLEDSPARCLRRHGRMFRSFLNKQQDQYIRFSAGAANTSMTSLLTGEAAAVDEDANILISDLQAPLFLAEVYSVRAKLTYEQLVALQETDPDADENVWGFIEFSQTDRDWKRGYLLEARQAADSNEVILQLIKANI